MNLQEYRTKSAALYADIDATLTKHGFMISDRKALIDRSSGTVRLTLTLNDANMTAADGSKTTPEAERFKRFAVMLGLKPEWLGKSLPAGHGLWFEVIGLKDTRGRKCIVLKRSDNRGYVTTPEDLIGRFARHAP